ncbi:hypothetical protein PC116_g18544, partial [Phytophthora cactorum]
MHCFSTEQPLLNRGPSAVRWSKLIRAGQFKHRSLKQTAPAAQGGANTAVATPITAAANAARRGVEDAFVSSLASSSLAVVGAVVTVAVVLAPLPAVPAVVPEVDESAQALDTHAGSRAGTVDSSHVKEPVDVYLLD